AAANHVGSQVVRRRYTVDCAGIFTVNQYDALIAVLYVGQKFLHNPLLAKSRRKKIVERSEIEVFAFEPEHCFTTSSVKRLHHDVAVLSAKRLDLGKVARNQGRGHQIGKLSYEYFLRCIADICGIVDHQRFRVDPLEQVRCRDIRKIEWRILAQEYNVEFRESHPAGLVQCEMVARLVADTERLDMREDLAIKQCEPVGRIIR